MKWVWSAILCGAVGAVLPLGGCGGDDSDDSMTEEPPPLHPAAAKLAPATLPWPARTAEVGVLESGTVIGRRIHHEPTGGTVEWAEWEGALTAAVALDDRVVVVFPPADREGFDLAIGGLDQPWERVPLNDTAPKHIGDLEATRDASGTVWIVMRERTGDQAITLYRWRPGEAVVSEALPRPFAPTAHWFHDTCEDLAIGVAGPRMDVVFQQVDNQGISQVIHLSRANETSPWATKVVTTSVTVPDTPADNRFFSVGCRNVMAHDESGRPHILTLQQELHTQLLGGGAGTPLPMPILKTWGYFLSADHQWLLARAARLPDGVAVPAGPATYNWDDSDDTYTAQIDLDRHPADGFLWAGPRLPPEGQKLRTGYSLFPLSMVYDFGAVDHNAYFHETVAVEPFDWVRSGGKLEITECGIVIIHGEPVVVRDRAHQRVGIYGAEPFCYFAPKAPIRSEELDTPRYANWARGERPYDVAVCLDGPDADIVTICEGAHEIKTDWDAYYDEHEVPRIASVEPADGVLSETTPIVVHMDRPPVGDESWDYQLLRTFDGSRVDHDASFDLASGTLTLTPKETWLPSSQLRLAVWYQVNGHQVQAWRYDQMPVTWFRVGDPPLRDDPRDVPPRLACDAEAGLARDDDGMCVSTQTWSTEANGPALPIPVPFDRQRTGDPILRHPGGSVVASMVGDIAGVYALRWTEPLEGDTRYELVIPDDAKNLVGSWIHPDDRMIGVVTGVPQPALVTSAPQDGDSNVDRSAPLDLTFNTPVTIPAGAVTLALGATPVTVSIVQQTTTTFQVLHEMLEPLSTYTLTLSTTIENTEGDPLLEAIIITFTTEP